MDIESLRQDAKWAKQISFMYEAEIEVHMLYVRYGWIIYTECTIFC